MYYSRRRGIEILFAGALLASGCTQPKPTPIDPRLVRQPDNATINVEKIGNREILKKRSSSYEIELDLPLGHTNIEDGNLTVKTQPVPVDKIKAGGAELLAQIGNGKVDARLLIQLKNTKGLLLKFYLFQPSSVQGIVTPTYEGEVISTGGEHTIRVLGISGT